MTTTTKRTKFTRKKVTHLRSQIPAYVPRIDLWGSQERGRQKSHCNISSFPRRRCNRISKDRRITSMLSSVEHESIRSENLSMRDPRNIPVGASYRAIVI